MRRERPAKCLEGHIHDSGLLGQRLQRPLQIIANPEGRPELGGKQEVVRRRLRRPVVWIRDPTELQPSPDFLFEVGADRNLTVARCTFCFTDPCLALFGFLQCLVDPKNSGLDIVDAKNKHLLRPKTANQEDACYEVLA